MTMVAATFDFHSASPLAGRKLETWGAWSVSCAIRGRYWRFGKLRTWHGIPIDRLCGIHVFALGPIWLTVTAPVDLWSAWRGSVRLGLVGEGYRLRYSTWGGK